MRSCRWLVIAIASSLAGSSTFAAPINDLPAPIATRQTAFSIPFTVPMAADPAQQPSEVRLFVSADRGATWKPEAQNDLKGQTAVFRGSFTFKAPNDGDYWFAIRTVDRNGQMKSERDGGPALRVIVDTLAPRLDLKAERGDAGEIIVRWQAVDPNLKPESLRIDYQPTDGSSWRNIAIDPPRSEALRSTLNDSTTWWPTETSGAITVRAEVSDLAGNVTTAQAKVDLQKRNEARGDSLARPTFGAPVDRGLPVERGPSFGLPERNPMLDRRAPFDNAPSLDRGLAPDRGLQPDRGLPPDRGPSDRGPIDRGVGLDRNLGTDRGPIDDRNSAPFGGRSQFDRNEAPRSSTGQSAVWAPDARTDVPLGRATNEARTPVRPSSSEAFGVGIGLDRPAGFVARRTESPIAPPVASQFSLDRPTDNRSFTSAASQPANFDFVLPPGERLRMVNSKAFELDYEVDAIGRSGIAKVELWVTRDSGRTWQSMGVDGDNRSPFRVSVDGEGVYGFKISVQSGSGLGGRPPASGDLPEVWIGIDLTRPTARLTAAEAGAGERTGELILRWEANDAALAQRPITLSYSQQPGGPWTTIAAGLENGGAYGWRYDNNVPDRIYLRLEARDESGNIGAFETAEPVSLERVVPQGRVRSVRPVGDAS